MNDIQPHAFTNLGAIPRTKKSTDYLIATTPAYNYPTTLMRDIAFSAPIYYQGQRPACGAHAGTWLKVFLNRLDGTNASENDTPRYLWIQIKKDGTSPSDGTSMDRVFTCLKAGCDTFEPLENNVMFDDLDYANIDALTPATSLAASSNTIAAYAYPQDQTFSGIKQAISDFGAVILEMELCARFWTAENGQTSWAEKDILPLAPPSSEFPVVSSHFVVAHSYDENYIYFANSFGPTWGRNGHGYFGANYIPYVVDVGEANNAPKPISQSQQLVNQLTPLVQKVTQLPPSPEKETFIQELESILATIAKEI